jgi:integrase
MGLTIALTADELGQCLGYFLHCEAHRSGAMWAAMMAYQYLSGARISEVLELQRRQICDEQGRLHPHFKRRKLKTGKSNVEHIVRIDIECPLAHIVSDWLAQSRRQFARISGDDWAFAWGFAAHPVRRNSAWAAYLRAYKHLQIDYVSRGTHAIRKTAGEMQYDINKAASGDGYRAVQLTQNFYGHASAVTTEKYLRVKPGDAQQLAQLHGGKIQVAD